MNTQRTKEERKARVEKVYQMLLLGLRPEQIFQNLTAAAAKAGIEARSERTYFKDLKEARLLLEKDAAPQRRLELGKAKAQLAWLFTKLAAIQDYKGALAVRRERSELLGLHEAKTVNIQEFVPIRYVPVKPKEPGKIK